MKKGQLISQVAQAIALLEESSCKRGFVSYSGHCQFLAVSVVPNEEVYLRKIMDKCISLKSATEKDVLDWFLAFTLELEQVRALPDGPIEEMVTIQIPKSKAIEMGVV